MDDSWNIAHKVKMYRMWKYYARRCLSFISHPSKYLPAQKRPESCLLVNNIIPNFHFWAKYFPSWEKCAALKSKRAALFLLLSFRSGTRRLTPGCEGWEWSEITADSHAPINGPICTQKILNWDLSACSARARFLQQAVYIISRHSIHALQSQYLAAT